MGSCTYIFGDSNINSLIQTEEETKLTIGSNWCTTPFSSLISDYKDCSADWRGTSWISQRFSFSSCIAKLEEAIQNKETDVFMAQLHLL